MAAWLAACAQNPPAPVHDLSHVVGTRAAVSSPAATPATPPDVYVVKAGDSLYAIAFRNQLDWRELAAWNGIKPPYTIYPGVTLQLRQPSGYRAPATVAAAPVFEAVESPATAPLAPHPAPATTPAPVVAASNGQATAKTPTEHPVASPPAAVEPPATATASPVTTVSGPTRLVDGIRWQWPADGRVLQGYVAADPTRQGIDIGGRSGAPVRAAADGVVVYSGNGLVGYGELVIIKHSDIYLSAYGHNRKRFVNEGARVKAGQSIAEMGSTGAPRTELHFEIRKQGKPIDPLGFLPTR